MDQLAAKLSPRMPPLGPVTEPRTPPLGHVSSPPHPAPQESYRLTMRVRRGWRTQAISFMALGSA